MLPPNESQRRTVLMYDADSRRGFDVYIVGEYLAQPVIEIVDYVHSKSKERRHRLFRVDLLGFCRSVTAIDVEPFDIGPLANSDRAWLNNWTKELI